MTTIFHNYVFFSQYSLALKANKLCSILQAKSRSFRLLAYGISINTIKSHSKKKEVLNNFEESEDRAQLNEAPYQINFFKHSNHKIVIVINLQTVKAPLESQAQGTRLFTSVASSQKVVREGSPKAVRVRFPEDQRGQIRCRLSRELEGR